MTNSMMPLTEQELRSEQRKVVSRAVAGLACCAAVLTGSFILLPRYFAFPATLAERLAFALQADLFVFLWLIVAVQLVSYGRFRSRADNRGSAFGPPSPAIAIRVAFLQNSLEQAVMAVGAHLIFATLVSGPSLALIPGAVTLFAVGRITFLWGYPKGAGGRAFGIVVTAIPTVAAFAFAVVAVGGRFVGFQTIPLQ